MGIKNVLQTNLELDAESSEGMVWRQLQRSILVSGSAEHTLLRKTQTAIVYYA
jgi:hypothetical protein